MQSESQGDSLASLKVHIVHVGSMNNKGAQALLKSDVSVIASTVKACAPTDVVFSVSATDIEGVRRLDLPLVAILPPMVDIPHEAADSLARRFGFARENLKYKVFAIGCLVNMVFQAGMSLISVIFAKAGLRAFYRADLVKHVKNCDLVISCSDENFKEGTSELPLNIYWIITWWSMLFSRAWEISVARFFKKPIILFPNSIGPVRTWLGRFFLRFSLNSCDQILIRDSISYEIACSLQIKPEKVLTTDTAILFEPTRKRAHMNDLSHPLIGVCPGVYSRSLSEEETQSYILAHAKALDRAIEKYGFNVTFLPHYVGGLRDDDLKICESLQEKMKRKDKTRIVNAANVEEFKLLLDQMDMIIASKMHPAVLGVSGYVPTLCIAYDHKQIGFFKDLGMADCTINLREFSYESVSSKIDFIWDEREKIRDLLKDQLPALKEHAKRVIEKAIMPFVKSLR